jgi:serine/threonine protein kinase
MEQSDVKLLFYELNLLQELNHPNITKVGEFLEDKERYYVVYDHPNFEDLYDLITKEEISEGQAKNIIR